MKQSIRINTFETNSSSYHTLSITNIKDLSNHKVIEKDTNLVINTHYPIEEISFDTEMCKAISNYEKAQMLLAIIWYDVDSQVEKICESNTYANYSERELDYAEHIYDTPLIKAFIKAIKRYIGEEHSVVIDYYMCHGISDESKSTEELLGVQDLKDEELLESIFYTYIFNPNYQITDVKGG